MRQSRARLRALARVGMARWQEGTRATLGVPWIALVGYPTLACAALLV